MDELVDRIEAALRKHLLAEIPHDATGELETMRLPELLIAFGNWRRRLVPAQPRNCHLSRELAASPKATEHKRLVDAIVAKIEAGVDLRPHLSRRVEIGHQGGAASTPLSQRRDLDLLIADWGLHHLHLSTTIEADGYVERGDDILFAAFTHSDAYLLEIYPHGAWADKSLLEIVVRNWPASGVLTPIQGVRLASAEPTVAERLQLRAAGVQTMLEIDEVVFMPSGMTTAGTPIEATIDTNNLMGALDRLRQDADVEREFEALQAAGHDVVADWEPTIHDGYVTLHFDGNRLIIGRLP